jgi:hypothetical protein
MTKSKPIHGGPFSPVRMAALLIAASTAAFGQTGGGYINYSQVQGEPISLSLNAIDIPASPGWTDVRSIGMGRTQTADGRFRIAMLNNPALLSIPRQRIEAFGFQVGFPKTTFDAASFVKNNRHQFQTGDFLKQLGEGFRDYYSADTPEQQRTAVGKINRALDFPNALLDKTVGDPLNPRTHGFNASPVLQVQWDHWGAALFANAEIGFVIDPGETTTKLLGLHIPENTQDLTSDVLLNLAQIVGTLFDENGDISSAALPKAFAMSHIDIVAAVGRSFRVNDRLDAGVNLKVINRRFSTKLISADNLDRVLSEARADLRHTATGFTFDVGALYRFSPTGPRVGVAVQNLLPVKTVSSSTAFDFTIPAGAAYVDDGTGSPAVGSVDGSGNYIPDPAGDTLLVIENRDLHIVQPFRLKAPLLVNAGVLVPIRPHWDATFDWADMLSKDKTYDKTADRIRIGTEYRVPQLDERLALRAGLAGRRLTGGVGVTLSVVQIDFAYARDPFLEKDALYTQVRFAW